MKKTKVSSIAQENNVNSLINLIGFTSSGLVKTTAPIADLSNSLLVDANKLHEIYGPKMVLKYSAPSSTNVPTSSGLIIHLQRNIKGDVSLSQIIGQLFFGADGVYSRSGIGNGTSITFTPWLPLG